MATSTTTVQDVDAIAAMGEPILRNLRITAAYGDLSRAVAGWLPGSANWCTFATWASRQAGCSIRKEDVARLVARRLATRLAQRPLLRPLHEGLDIPVERVATIVGDLSQALPGVDRASDAVGRGNLKVFAEIGREFARFLAALSDADAGVVDRFIASLTPGSPPDGQDLLRSAFSHYLAARATAAGSARAQLVLLANLQIGLHEQTRLQPEIREAMDAAMLDVADTRRRVLERLEEVLLAPLRAVRRRLGTDVLNLVAEDIAVVLRGIVREITTDRLMTIGLPGDRTLQLGRDVVGAYPAALTVITNESLQALLATYDTTADSTRGSAAIDWSALAQRLHYIADLFRAYQEDGTLLGPPFSPAQLAEIAAGRVPVHL